MTSARAALVASLAAAAACRTPAVVEPVATPAVGVSIALYRDGELSYGVVDDRRWVEVTGTTLILDHVDPGAALPSLVIEPLGTTPITVGQCARDHLRHVTEESSAVGVRKPQEWIDIENSIAPDPERPAPIVASSLRCHVRGTSGRHLVRLLYVSPRLGYRAQHDITMTAGDRATIATRFAIETPAWSAAADVTLFQGVPGGETSPIPIGRGSIKLDGSTAVLAAALREVSAQLRWIYDGAVRAGHTIETDASWGRESVRAVWVWLELADRELTPGAVHAHVEAPGEAIRDVEVPASGREVIGATLRLPLWIDDTLHGLRNRAVMGADGASLADRFVISVANTGSEPREVWVEERLRTAKRRVLRSGWPTKPSIGHGRARSRLSIKPGAMERTGYVIEYVF